MALCVARLRLAISQIRLPDGATFRDEALLKWDIYLGILTVDYAEAVLELIEKNKARAMQSLGRSIYEFLTKVKYFAANPKDAASQVGSLDARMFAEMMRLQYSSEAVGDDIKQRFEAWKQANPNLSPHDGERRFHRMHLAITPEASLRLNDQGEQESPEYAINYGAPSLFVHGEAAAMEDVLPHVRRRGNVEFRYESGMADTLQELGRVVAYLWSFILHLARQHSLAWQDVKELVERGQTIQQLDLARRRKAGQQYMDSI